MEADQKIEEVEGTNKDEDVDSQDKKHPEQPLKIPLDSNSPQSNDSKKEKFELDCDSNSGKCNSVAKKTIKLPKHKKKSVQKNITSKIVNENLIKTYSNFDITGGSAKKSHKYRTMKSMSPRKKFYASNLNMSMEMSSMANSHGFNSEFNPFYRRRQKGHNYRSLMTLQRAGPGSYNLPSLIGRFCIDANKPNGPRYSISKADKFSMKALDKDQIS